jgi:hypothetical protein
MPRVDEKGNRASEEIVYESDDNLQFDWDDVFFAVISSVIPAIFAFGLLGGAGSMVATSASQWQGARIGLVSLLLAALSTLMVRWGVGRMMGADLPSRDHLRVPKNFAAGTMVISCLTGFTLGLLLPLSPQKPPSTMEASTVCQKWWANLDTNEDGTVEEGELQALLSPDAALVDDITPRERRALGWLGNHLSEVGHYIRSKMMTDGMTYHSVYGVTKAELQKRVAAEEQKSSSVPAETPSQR